jgi:hypothetical protein
MIVRRGGDRTQNFGAVKDFGHIGRLTVGAGLHIPVMASCMVCGV